MIQISLDEFQEEYVKLCHLCGFVANKSSIPSYYDAVKFEKKEKLLAGMRLMTQDPPSKLTLRTLKYFMREAKMDEAKAVWNGKECEDDACGMGLVHEVIEGYSFVFRCPKCNSTAYRFNNYHQDETYRIKKKMKNGDFINNESRKN